MKLILYFILIIIFYSCNNVESKQTGLTLMGHKIQIIIIDSCEYINLSNSNIVHKGNCKNH